MLTCSALCCCFCRLPRQTFLPLDLRVKKTRAIRRRLSKEQVRPERCCLVHCA
jgi:hypothetical protein